jgi:hypothetical protein
MILTIAGANFSGANIGTNTNVGITLTKGNGVSGSKVSSLTLERNQVVSTATVIATGLSLQTGYENLVVTVTMTGTGDVSRWFSNGTVTIPSGTKITGNIKITASATAVSGGEVVDPEEPGTGGGSGETDSIVFNFDQTNENGVDLSQAGTISGGKLTISTPKTIDYSGITLSSTEDWTFECIALPSTSTGLIPLGSESTKGGFIQLPNPKGADTACIRFRDLNRTMSAEASWTTGFTEPTHFAITYSASPKELKMYMNYSELPVAYGTGSIDSFNTFTPHKLFGGYNNGIYDFCGDLYYMSFTNSVLTSDQFHRE